VVLNGVYLGMAIQAVVPPGRPVSLMDIMIP